LQHLREPILKKKIGKEKGREGEEGKGREGRGKTTLPVANSCYATAYMG